MLSKRKHVRYQGVSADATNQAWKMLLESKDDLENVQSFRFDLLTSQGNLCLLFLKSLLKMILSRQ